MKVRNNFKGIAIAVAMTANSFFALKAQAIEMGPDGCLPPAELLAQLKAEGQVTAIKANRVYPETASSPASTTFVAFTTNADGSRGYSFEGDQPDGVPSTKFCLAKTFTKTKVLNASVAAIPAEVAANSNLGKVISYSSIKRNLNPVFYGENNGAITVVIGNPSIKGQFNGMILIGSNDPKFKADDQGGLIGLAYGANYKQDK